MKNKLKLLFAYFRSFKDENVTAYVSLEDGEIEDWTGKFQVNGKNIEPVGSINTIIEELIELYKDEFDRYNNYEIDSYWHLEIDINPFENKLTFKSECKVETAKRHKKQYDFKDLSPENKDFINEIYEENENLTKFEIEFTGRFDQDKVNAVYFDGRKHNFDDDDGFWGLIVDLMHKAEGGSHWNEGPGVEGDLIVWDSVMFLDYTRYDEEYEDTNMNIEITPENFND